MVLKRVVRHLNINLPEQKGTIDNLSAEIGKLKRNLKKGGLKCTD